MSSLIYFKKTIDSKNKVSPYEESNLPKKRLSRIHEIDDIAASIQTDRQLRIC